MSNYKTQLNDEINEAKKSALSSTVVAVISTVLTLMTLSLVMVIVFHIKGKINIRQLSFSSKRGSRVASPRNATTYYEIDEKKLEENELNKYPEPEIYESIDQSKKDTTKYSELPTRPRVSKQERKLMTSISMHKIMDDDSENNEDEDYDNKCVQMRKDKVRQADLLKKMGKTSTKISGYIEMGKKIPEEYVPMTAKKLDI